MPKRSWKSPQDLLPAAPGGRSDEFTPEVAAAIEDLRRRHGLDSPACNHRAEAQDAARSGLKELLAGVNRRGFLQLSGAAAVFALAGCGPKQPDTVVPHRVQPEGTVLGKPVFWSSVVRDSGRPVPVLVKTYDGRPIKLEGNPDDPLVQGGSDLRTQAALLDLYDPDRLQQGPQRRDGEGFAKATWAELDAAVGAALKGSSRIGLLTGAIDGPARRRLIEDLKQACGSRLQHAVFEALPSWRRRLALVCGGLITQGIWPPVWRLDRAKALVCFGDLLAQAGMAEQAGYGAFRRGEGVLVAVEAVLSQTGSVADLRLRCAADRLDWAAWGLAEALARRSGEKLPDEARAALDRVRGADLSASLGLKPVSIDGRQVPALDWIAELLAAEAPASLVWAGDGSLALQQAAVFCNRLLKAETAVIEEGPETALAEDWSSMSDEAVGEADELLAACAAGEIDVLIVAGCNPAFHAPGCIPGLQAVKTLVACADRLDETAVLAHWVAPGTHDLEAWGDAEPRCGLFAVQQPCILPLWDARCAEESLMAFAAAAGLAFTAPVQADAPQASSVVSRVPLWEARRAGVRPWRELVRETWLRDLRPRLGTGVGEQAFWNGALARGLVQVQPLGVMLAYPTVALPVRLAPWIETGYRLQLSPSRSLGDGTWANNPWLLETPDPVSKITWDNYLAISPVDASREFIGEGELVEVSAGGQVFRLPAHVQEGQHPGTLECFLGWGRRRAGAVAALALGEGFNGFALAGRGGRMLHAASIRKAGGRVELACVQGHQRLEGRPLPLQAGDEGHGHGPRWVAGSDGKPGGRLNLWGKTHAYLGRRWGMAIDLDACHGCNACLVACSAENNVPVVGRDEVVKNRELHWIRIDRYYLSDAKGPEGLLDVEVVHQPMLCQHCDNAPCEVVCPANATMHSDEGQSLQVYNRCIGTRYCANNCPYKVRHFNWYEYSAYRAGPVGSADPARRIVANLLAEGSTSAKGELALSPLQLLLNPEVTVRTKGVMEKCSFCVQRTRNANSDEKAAGRALPDGAVTTACAQACPTRAITFGDLNNPASAVRRISETQDHRAFHALDEELNTRPAVAYLQRRRNLGGAHG